MNRETAWCFIFFCCSASLLLAVAALNYFVDPGYQYRHNHALQAAEDDLAKRFLNANVGVVFKGNERVLAHTLAAQAPKQDCIVLGSSRAMQISTVRGSDEFKELCPQLLNLAVFGGTIEDTLVFLDTLKTRNALPSSLFLELSPWMLKWGMDKRYLMYRAELSSVLQRHPFPSHPKGSIGLPILTHLRNLTNFEYTALSLRALLADPYKAIHPQISEQFWEVEPFSFDAGLESQVRLRDGSLVYDRSHLEENTTGKDYYNPGNYKLTGAYFDEKLIRDLGEYLATLQGKTQVHLVLTPYHDSFFRPENTRNNVYVKEVEKRVRTLASDLGFPVLGSYQAKNIPCAPEEFYDFMHPKATCVQRLL